MLENHRFRPDRARQTVEQVTDPHGIETRRFDRDRLQDVRPVNLRPNPLAEVNGQSVAQDLAEPAGARASPVSCPDLLRPKDLCREEVRYARNELYEVGLLPVPV